LDQFRRTGVPAEPPPPRFAVELPLPLAEAFAPFRSAVTAEAVRAAGCPGLLLLLGQRLTPASVTAARSIPRPRAELLAAAAAPNRQGLSAAARALAKHAGRSAGAFWELPRGPVAARNAAALAA